MRYGKIRVENGCLLYSRHMMLYSLPCREILWAYMRREGGAGNRGFSKQMISHSLVIITRKKKHYSFDMTEKEIQECLRHLKALNPEMAVGFPKGGPLPFQSLLNIRDLGALENIEGRFILPRRLLRSGELYHASLSDERQLSEEYHVKTVIDLRTEAERKRKPDATLPGVEYYHIPVMEDNSYRGGDGADLYQFILQYQGDGEEFMTQRYSSLIRDKYALDQYARFLDVLLHHGEGAVLWHCYDGKDRTGVATALLLCALGIPEETIREDFMRSNACLDMELQYMLRYMEAMGKDSPLAAENMSIFYRVKRSYIDHVFEDIRLEYGTVDRFLRRGLYLTPRAMEELQDKYLV